MSAYRVLTMDGGGIRGVLTARLLERIENSLPGFLSRVDLFAGTSTGSLLAVALALGLTPAQLVELYRQQGPVIFNDDIFHEVGDLWGLTGARYSTSNRYKGIHPTVGDTTLGELARKVLVPTFELDSENPLSPAKPGSPHTWKAKFFHNFPNDSDGTPNGDLGTKAVDVVMRSSAAPTYFPVYQGFIDGGVVANNPSLSALAQAVNPHTGAQPLQDVVLLSVGTGTRPQYLTTRDANWGLSQWGFKLIDLLFDAGSGLADYQCGQLIGDCYKRLNANLQEDIGLDAVGKTDDLIQIADDMAQDGSLEPTLNWLQEKWMPNQ